LTGGPQNFQLEGFVVLRLAGVTCVNKGATIQLTGQQGDFGGVAANIGLPITINFGSITTSSPPDIVVPILTKQYTTTGVGLSDVIQIDLTLNGALSAGTAKLVYAALKATRGGMVVNGVQNTVGT
jgi:hypothetical protein